MPKEKDEDSVPVSSLVASRGIKTAADFAEFMGALMGDLVDKRVEPSTAEAACLAGKTLLDIVKLQLEYGEVGKDGSRKLSLNGDGSITTARRIQE